MTILEFRILSLHFSYAVLFTASPMFLADAGVWGDLAQSHDGYQQLERGRDAAAAVIHAICSVRALSIMPGPVGRELADAILSARDPPHPPIVSSCKPA